MRKKLGLLNDRVIVCFLLVNPIVSAEASLRLSQMRVQSAVREGVSLTAVVSVSGIHDRKHQDWFDDNSQQIRDLLKAKNEAHAAKLRNPTSSTLHNNWKELRSKAQRELRQMENKWWIERTRKSSSTPMPMKSKNSIRQSKPSMGLCRT